MAHTTTDFEIENHGSLFLVRPTNPEAEQHLRDNVGEEAQWLGNALAVEHRYIADLAQALQDNGYSVE